MMSLSAPSETAYSIPIATAPSQVPGTKEVDLAIGYLSRPARFSYRVATKLVHGFRGRVGQYLKYSVKWCTHYTCTCHVTCTHAIKKASL